MSASSFAYPFLRKSALERREHPTTPKGVVSMNMGKQKALMLAALAVAVLGVAWLGVSYYASRVAPEPMLEVVQGIGHLEPLSTPLPNGSAVLSGEEVVATLSEVVDVRPAEPQARRFIILRGSWLASAPERLRADSSVLGVITSEASPGQPVVVRLSSGSENAGSFAGHLVLKPGERTIELRQ